MAAPGVEAPMSDLLREVARSARSWRGVSGARRGVTHTFDNSQAEPVLPSNAELRSCEAVRCPLKGRKWRARLFSEEARTERATPSLGLAPAEPGSPTGRSLITRCAVSPRKNRQSGLNSRWRLKASGCVKEGPQPRLIREVSVRGLVANARERAVPRRDIGIGHRSMAPERGQ